MAAAPLQMASQPLGTLFSIRFLWESGVRVAIVTEQESSVSTKSFSKFCLPRNFELDLDLGPAESWLPSRMEDSSCGPFHGI